MILAEDIIAYVDRIAALVKPRRIVLFGSYAAGNPTEDSDVDLLITKSRWPTSPLTMAGRICVALGVPFAMDVIVKSEANVRRGLRIGDAFIREIMEKGITLYAADDARVGHEGRRRLRRRLTSTSSVESRSAAVAQEVAAR
jgi:predicted nucleotidyltransferase